MIFWYLLICVIVVIILYILIYNGTSEKFIKDIKIYHNQLSMKYFNTTFSFNNTNYNPNNHNLVTDSIIVCSAMKDLPATPFFYFQELPDDFYKNGWFFVNLNYTDLENTDSPINIICKTKQTYNILQNMFPHKNIIYTGFTSIDKYNPSIPKNYKKFIHIIGQKSWEASTPIIQAWEKHPEWPELTIVCTQKSENYTNAININIVNTSLHDNQVDHLINSNSIHIYASENQDFEHYLNEGRSVKAVVLYPETPLMNEFFTPETGIPINTYQSHFINSGICPVYKTTPNDIEVAVEKALKMSIDDLSEMGNQARLDFITNDKEFRQNISSYIKGSRKIPHIVHFIWISKNNPYEDVEIPEKYNKYIKTWKENNSDFEYMFWSGKKILNLIKENIPKFLNFYKSISKVISKCDFARFCILYVYGGVYCDLDFFCRKNISPLLECESFSIFEPEEHSMIVNSKLLCNGFIASCPLNEFIYEWIETMSNKDPLGDVLKTTGPIAFYNYFKNSPHSFPIGNTCDVCPIINTSEFAHQCSTHYNNYICTIWNDGSDWDIDNYNEYNNKNNISGKYKYTQNPIDKSIILFERNQIHNINVNFQSFQKYLSLPQNEKIYISGLESIFIAHALKNADKNISVFTKGENIQESQLIEKMAIINGLSNLYVD